MPLTDLPRNSKHEPTCLLITHDSAEARVVAHALANSLPLAGIVVRCRQPSIPQPHSVMGQLAPRVAARRLLAATRAVRSRSYVSSLTRRVKRVEQRLIRRAARQLRSYAGRNERYWPEDVARLETLDVNSPESVSWCRSRHASLFAVFGTDTLRSEILELPELGTLNAHLSLLPEHRGAWPEFWQAWDGDYLSCGVTVHIAEPEVDAGDILAHQASHITPGSGPAAIRVANVIVAAELFPQTIQSVLAGDWQRVPQPTPRSRARRISEVTLERKRELYERLGLLH